MKLKKLTIEVPEDLLRRAVTASGTDGYWERAGMLRAKLLRNARKANLTDTLITQSCLDHNAGLMTRDTDFQIFKPLAGLKLLK